MDTRITSSSAALGRNRPNQPRLVPQIHYPLTPLPSIRMKGVQQAAIAGDDFIHYDQTAEAGLPQSERRHQRNWKERSNSLLLQNISLKN